MIESASDPHPALRATFSTREKDAPGIVDRTSELFLGADALDLVDRKLDRMRGEMAAWDALSRSTSFPAAPDEG